jgi:hypothetical protein
VLYYLAIDPDRRGDCGHPHPEIFKYLEPALPSAPEVVGERHDAYINFLKVPYLVFLRPRSLVYLYAFYIQKIVADNGESRLGELPCEVLENRLKLPQINQVSWTLSTRLRPLASA